MWTWISSYALFEVLVIAAALAATWYVRTQRKHMKRDVPPPGFTPTDEVFTDPTTGVVQRVWFHPQTGARFYQTLRNDGQTFDSTKR